VVAVRVTTLTVRKMDDAKARLRVQATLSQEPVSGTSLVEAMRARMTPLGGVVLDLPEREVIRGGQYVR
jgi:hypothetical protein